MYQVFAYDTTGSALYIGLLAGEQANQLVNWMRNEPGTSNSFSIEDVPIISFSAAAPSDFQVATWRIGAVHADRTVSTRWTWGSGTKKLPPKPSFTYRLFQMGVSIGRQYRCVGFSNMGVPRLDLNHCTGEGEHWILLQAQIVQITEMLAMANGDKRKFEATFPTSACHLHDHNHRDEDQDRDDSPPPEGKRIKTL